jgi:hypothetical protein
MTPLVMKQLRLPSTASLSPVLLVERSSFTGFGEHRRPAVRKAPVSSTALQLLATGNTLRGETIMDRRERIERKLVTISLMVLRVVAFRLRFDAVLLQVPLMTMDRSTQSAKCPARLPPLIRVLHRIHVFSSSVDFYSWIWFWTSVRVLLARISSHIARLPSLSCPSLLERR